MRLCCVTYRSDVSKTFDCISHDLIIAKHYAYDFDIPSMKLTNSY